MSTSARPVAAGGWRLWRATVGIFYLLAAAFNASYTIPIADDRATFDGYADGAWFPALEEFVRDVFAPNGVALMTMVVVFEIAVGVLILSQGILVDAGVVASVGWVVAIMPFLAWPYILVNVALVVAQGAVLLRTYDRSVWPIHKVRHHRPPATVGHGRR